MRHLSAPLLVAAVFLAGDARAGGHPNGASILRLLGRHAGRALSATGNPDTLSALLRLPPGVTAASLGAEPVVPGFARVRGGANAILAFASAHPDVSLEVVPPLHPLLDTAASWIGATAAHQDPNSLGDGTLVGVADTGIDVTLADFRDASGHTRVAWLLDMSRPPVGKYPDLEQKYGAVDTNGNVIAGAVFDSDDINAILASKDQPPGDEVGHGTHVASIAAGNGGGTIYVGIAPNAQIVFARITTDSTESIDNDNMTRGAQFLFDRADFMKKPIAVNLSLGTDFGPHDGTMAWEEVLASYVGPSQPGHAIVAAAGNSGSIVESPIHQSAGVSQGGTISVPITTRSNAALGVEPSGVVQVWVTFRAGSALSVGLVGPDGTWISPQADGQEAGKNAGTPPDGGYEAVTNAAAGSPYVYASAVINGTTALMSPVPTNSNGAVVILSGRWPIGTYAITLQGHGTADLFLEADGDVGGGFVSPVREGTVNLPATNPAILGVGCTMNKVGWIATGGLSESVSVPELDSTGAYPASDPTKPGVVLQRAPANGEVAWFSSAGPTVTGAQKPEIAAPGGIVIAAMSSEAAPGSANTIFFSSDQVDLNHAVSLGTSMAAPMVAGAIALLFERDPTLTQDKLVALLQAGAHRFRGAAPFDDQAGPGELDIPGTLAALAVDPSQLLPSASASWMTLSADYVAADGSTPLTVILELRTADGTRRADMFDPTRLQPVVRLNGALQSPPSIVRRGPGLWFFVVTPPAGTGGSTLSVGATFDGAAIVTAKSIPIAVDVWRAEFASRASGSGCGVSPVGAGRGGAWFASFSLLFGLVGVSARRGRRAVLACCRWRSRRSLRAG